MDSNVLLAPLGFLGMYMLLESCDWGLSLVAPFACRNQEENEAVLGVMKPGIDGNEAWFFLGLVLMGAAVPIAGGVSPFPVALLMGLVGLGALLRIAGCYGRKSLGSSPVMKGLCAFSVISMGAFGLFAGSLVSEDGGMFSALGIVSALWCILAAFQVGALFGAAKIVNPLGERFRAAFLVSSVLSLVLFLATAMVLGGAVGDVPFCGASGGSVLPHSYASGDGRACGFVCFLRRFAGSLLCRHRRGHGKNSRRSSRFDGCGAGYHDPGGRHRLDGGRFPVAPFPQEGKL